MKLYEINATLERLLMLENADADAMAVDTETGEVYSEEMINELQMAREEKIENVLLFCKNQDAEAEALDNEIVKLTERKKDCESRSKRGKAWVHAALDGEKFSTPKVAVSYRTTKVCEVSVEPEKLPEQFQNVKTTISAKKADLKKWILAGNKVEGVQVVESKSMTIK